MNVQFVMSLGNMEIIIYIIRIFFICTFTFYTAIKIVNIQNLDKKANIKIYIEILITSVICGLVRYLDKPLDSTICLIFFMVANYLSITKSSVMHSIIIVLISLSINNCFYFVAVVLAYYPIVLFSIRNDIISLLTILVIYVALILVFLKIRKFKYGMSFLKRDKSNGYVDILILNISVVILFITVIFANSNIELTKSLFVGIIIFSIIMFITIKESLYLYYKQKLLIQELKETKEELANKTKELQDLEAENLSFSKKSHSLAHKQKSLEYKLQQLINKTEISKEEAAEVKDKLEKISKDIYKETATIELDKTGIIEIDDMLEYMQSECKKNKIEFQLKLSGNIHQMTNNFISKEDLEILLADHIKNAIIAINHTKNINRSILVKLGNINEIYSIYIYDSGAEFELETLQNIGKKPSTTHADEGGTGMGFMNTFDTLRKCQASLIIEEYNEPSKDNYTKAIIIKFDKKNEFKIESYRARFRDSH